MSGWQAVRIEVEEARAEALSEALLEAGALSVSIEDADAGSDAERPLFGEPGAEPCVAWARNLVVALCDPGADLTRLVADAAQAAGIQPPPAFRVDPIPEQDWVRQTQAQFSPMHIGERIWVVPSWHEPPAYTAALVIRLDPGLAFGTGSHATTRLVLQWLETSGCTGTRVLDYGCGSGILGIAAARLGAAQVDAVDVDPQALAAASANAVANQTAVRCATPDALPDGQYDLVLANILANPLVVLAPLIAARCRSGGRVALSGILPGQAPDVISAYAFAFELRVAAEDDGWVLIEGARR